MKIPFKFYASCWLYTSICAFATGSVIALLIPPLFVLCPFFGFYFFFVYQIILIYRYFRGDRKGNFEYKYRESLIDRNVKKIIYDEYGTTTLLRYSMAKLNQTDSFQETLCKALIDKTEISDSGQHRFALFMKIAEVAMKNGDYMKEKKNLEEAVSIIPHDLIANYRLAVSYERTGATDKAIGFYKRAARGSYSSHLNDFILSQITRIESEGPRKRPPIPGLRFMTW